MNRCRPSINRKRRYFLGKAFKLPVWRKAQIDRKYHRKAAVVFSVLSQINQYFEQVTDQVVTHAFLNLRFKEPNLSSADHIAEHFYRRVITEGWKSAHEEALLEKDGGKQRLTAPPLGRIQPMKFLVEFFSDKKAWDKILSRKQFIVERLKRAYLQKLKRKFDEVLPEILSGETTPQEVKAHLSRAWDSTRSRTESIFRTETTKYFTETQLSYFSASDTDIIGYLFDSIGDSGRTSWCKDRHGLIYRPGTALLKQNAPPCHWQCRSHLIALANTEYNRKMLEDPARDPEKRTVAPLPPSWRK
jgi:SPP1 gp7 family putative phage head morphogenesis protein